jgi:parvulin-like peptidyl-prolyl isomerase
VVKSPYGFHVFKLEDRRPAGTRGLDEVSEDIARVLSQEKQEARFRQWMKELRSRTKFEVNYQALAR